MTQKSASKRRVVLARDLARRWLEHHVRPEHRLTVYPMGRDVRGLSNVLRSFRDERLRIGSVSPIPDLGVSEAFDSVTVWSSDLEGLRKLAQWFESSGYETTGVW